MGSRRIALQLIERYQRDVSHRLGSRCSFEVSCSHYAHRAFEHHTAPVALTMTTRRLVRCSRAARRGRPRRVLRIAAAVGILAVAVLMFPLLGALGPDAAPAAAATKGGGAAGCAASLAGTDAYTASSPDSAILVAEDASVVAAGSMSSGPVTYNVDLEFSGISWNVAKGTGTDSSWTDTVKIADYAKYGVGIYRVNVSSTSAAGQRCSLHAYVKVDASPLSSVAGKAAAAALALGAVGVAVPTALAFSQNSAPTGASLLDGPPLDPSDQVAIGAEESAARMCAPFLLAAVFLTAREILRSKGLA